MNYLAIIGAAMLLASIVLAFMALIRPRKCDRCGAPMEDDNDGGWECPKCGWRVY